MHFQLPNFAEWTLRFIAASERGETTVTGTRDSLKEKESPKFRHSAPIVNSTLLPPSFNSQILLKYIDFGIKFDNNK